MSVFSKLATQEKLSLGLVFPIESYSGSVPTMQDQEQLAKRAEALGFKALWFRDVPFQGWSLPYPVKSNHVSGK